MKLFQAIGVAAGILLSAQAAAECEFAVEVGDTIKFNVSTIEAPASCESVTINLTHTGNMAANLMGHNWVLTEDANVQPVATAGMAAGVDGSYLPAGDARVLAATKLIGGGESASVTFSPGDLDASKSYTFFCSFPGHWAVMRGQFKLI
ncbi:MAG: azurin [Pseudomonadota bacterium]